jgi:PAS domain S-box-containing protein
MPEQDVARARQDGISGFGDRLEELELNTVRRIDRARHARLAGAIMSEGLWEWDLGKLQISWDEAYERMFGPGPDVAEKGVRWWAHRIHPDDRQAVLRRVVGAHNGSADHWECKYRFRRRDGTFAFVLDRALIFRGPQGRALRILGTLLDLSERQRALQDLEEANRRKDHFLAMVSHELRNPLNAIAGWVALLRSGKLNEAAESHALEIIEQNTRLESRLVEDLLDVSRALTGRLDVKLSRVNIKDLAVCSVESAAPAASARGIQVDARLDDVGNVTGDSHRLRQAIENVLSNALKFTPRGGRVGVRLTKKAAGVAELAISDSGVGIRPDLLPQVFEQFWQARKPVNRQGGLGLGLAIAAHLVELHGGTIHIHSDGEGRGTTARIQLPLAPKGVRRGNKWIPTSVSSLLRRTSIVRRRR